MVIESIEIRSHQLETIGISTWYLYAKMLGFKRRIIPNPKKYRKGLKAVSPNQYWHADITLFDTLDGIRHYIYLDSDNFSRKILAWKADTQLSAEIRLQTLKEAWNNANDTFSSVRDVTLVTDGGSENNNAIVNKFIELHKENLQKKTALKDIPYSNSSIEAINKTLKYRYLYLRPCTAEGLQTKLQTTINDYNHIRPHGSLKGQTPDEAYLSETTPDIKAQMTKARTERMEKNRNFNCKTCK
jgi:putative transposase